MPRFRCLSCERAIESPVVIGAGDCPHCGGDVVFNVRGEGCSGARPEARPRRRPLLQRLLLR